MASAAYNSATPRQQELLTKSAAELGGFVAETDITSVTYASGTEVPETITYRNSNGTITRNVVGIYGDLGLRTDEINAIRQLRSVNQTAVTQTNLTTVTGNNNRNAFSLGDVFEDLTTQVVKDTLDDVGNTAGNLLKNAVGRRLENSGLSQGAELLSSLGGNILGNIVSRFPSLGTDLRVKISDPSGRISQLGGALAPLSKTDFKVVFPYTPEISITHSSNYTPMNPTHSNYDYLFYQNSSVSEINITATFSARNAEDAEYVLAVQHFFRSATKMFYGNDDIAGLPPIVCRLEGHGNLQFGYIPIVITSFSSTLPSDVDYVSAVNTRSTVGRVPTVQTMNIIARPIYSRSQTTNEFSLTDFAKGNLLGDPQSGRGGFI